MNIPSVGDDWLRGNLVWGDFLGDGEPISVLSPCDNSSIQTGNFLSTVELETLFRSKPEAPFSLDELWDFAERLHGGLTKYRAPLRDAMQRETGFVARDCDELLDGALEYAAGFAQYFPTGQRPLPAPQSYQLNGETRRIEMTPQPWGTVAVILPHNAFLLVGITCLLNALATGNRVVLRAPQQSARSALLLARIVREAGDAGLVSVVLAQSKDFVAALCASPEPALLHFMGGSGPVPGIWAQCFAAGKGFFADGQGNTLVYVDEDFDPLQSAEILCAGATRYNGQTCTSVNGAIIHPKIAADVLPLLRAKLAALRVGNPLEEACDIGPLFDEKQALRCVELMEESGGEITVGGVRDENFLTPTLVENPDFASPLVREGLFGPALWGAAGDAEIFNKVWRQNRFPLCAGVLSNKTNLSVCLPGVARIVRNGDPSCEFLFEPWGGYPSSGCNPVGAWHEKYQRMVAVDSR